MKDKITYLFFLLSFFAFSLLAQANVSPDTAKILSFTPTIQRTEFNFFDQKGERVKEPVDFMLICYGTYESPSVVGSHEISRLTQTCPTAKGGCDIETTGYFEAPLKKISHCALEVIIDNQHYVRKSALGVNLSALSCQKDNSSGESEWAKRWNSAKNQDGKYFTEVCTANIGIPAKSASEEEIAQMSAELYTSGSGTVTVVSYFSWLIPVATLLALRLILRRYVL